MAHALLLYKSAVNELRLLNGLAELLHQLDHLQIDVVVLLGIDHALNGLHGHRSKEPRVLRDDLKSLYIVPFAWQRPWTYLRVQAGGCQFDQLLVVVEIDGSGHAFEDFFRLGGGTLKALRDRRRMDT